ncbi:hypothetical protein GCM10010344_70980 [Streptomyces bluensis]|nr:hypothetical protein GCM10010344_70980 [Streptomyces bluensis]
MTMTAGPEHQVRFLCTTDALVMSVKADCQQHSTYFPPRPDESKCCARKIPLPADAPSASSWHRFATEYGSLSACQGSTGEGR